MLLVAAFLSITARAVAETCAGDCNADGVTTATEIADAVDIALLRAPLAACVAANRDGDLAVTVEEIVAAVNPIGNLCRNPTPTPTPTSTTPPSPSPTFGELTLAQKAVGPTQGAAAFFLALPRAYALIASRLGAGGETAPEQCAGGGTFTVECIHESPEAAAVYHIFAEDCAVADAGQSMRITGTMRFTGPAGVACFDGAAATFDMLVSFLAFEIDGETGLLVVSGEDLSGTLAIGTTADGCAAEKLDLLLSGEATLDARSAPRHALNGAVFRFDDLQVRTAIRTQGDACALRGFTTTVDGGLALRTGNNVFAAFYQSLALATAINDGEASVDVSGTFLSDCFSAPVEFDTVVPARLREGDACFRGGEVDLLHDGNGDRVRYTAIGGVDIDLERDGALDQRFPTCVSPELYVCTGG